jgi:hypothetical protein
MTSDRSHQSPFERLDRLARQLDSLDADTPRPASATALAAVVHTLLQSEAGREALRILLHEAADHMLDLRDAAAVAATLRFAGVSPCAKTNTG